uniref:Putative retrotransposon nucleocapsid n=1 Tax=Moniliophthora roreri TaxID=221103 RepID=A0A0W0FPW2_MONRR
MSAPISIYCFNTDRFDRPEPSPSPEPRLSPISSTMTRASVPPEPVPRNIQLRVQFSPKVEQIPITRAELNRTPTPPPWIGTPQLTPGIPPPGLSIPSPPNEPSLPENNANVATTESESPPSSSAPSLISIPEFINAINAVSGVTIHRTVETTSVQSATHTSLTISLNIAHDYDEVNEFLSQGLLGVIQLLMALRRTTLIRPPSPILPTSPTSTEDEEEAPPVYTIVRITDNREPITLTTDNGEERTFVPVRYVNRATVFEAGTSNQSRG